MPSILSEDPVNGEPSIRDELFTVLNTGAEIELVLNILIYAEFTRWGQDDALIII